MFEISIHLSWSLWMVGVRDGNEEKIVYQFPTIFSDMWHFCAKNLWWRWSGVGIRHAVTGVIFRAENMVLLVLYVWWQVWFFALDDVGLAFIHQTQRCVIFFPRALQSLIFHFCLLLSTIVMYDLSCFQSQFCVCLHIRANTWSNFCCENHVCPSSSKSTVWAALQPHQHQWVHV